MLMFSNFRKHVVRNSVFALLAFFVISFSVVTVLFQPSHDRDWEFGQEKLPHVTIQEDKEVIIENFRNFEWKDDGTAEARYETREFDFESLKTVDVFISHFDDFEGLAHIFLSFGFAENEHVVVSLETRREKGEEFSPLLGILRQLEIIYIVGSEEDIVGLRTDIRNERVYVYPTKATQDQAQKLFTLLVQDINAVYEKARMYNTLTHNCTNELSRRVEDMTELDFPFTWKTVLPGYFDEILYDLNIIDSSCTFAESKEKHLIDNISVNRYSASFQKDLRKN